MKPKEEVYKIKVKDCYGTTITKKLHCDADVNEMMQAWREILLALGYNDTNIREYIEPN